MMSSWKTCYPRPQLRRDSFLPLMDGWKLNGNSITMPFCPESLLSGYEGELGMSMTYETTFTLPKTFLPRGRRLLLHFGAVDQIAEVFLNGRPIVRHEGGYLPFSGDITHALVQGENYLTVCVMDGLDRDYPYGKQRKKRGGMWYTPVTGIWQTAWLEAVPEKAITGLKITPDLTGIDLQVDTAAERCEAIVRLEGMEVARTAWDGADRIRIDIPAEHIRLWTPDSPTLYDLAITAGEDQVASYFALRTVGIKPDKQGVSRLCLNGEPVFLNGVLDQGYFTDGHYLPGDPAEYERDVRRMKELGFNMLRKHIKVEPEAFYEACDRLGMLVVQDMVNNGGYNYVFDTVLPTIGFQWRPNWPVSKRRKEIFEACAAETIAHLHDHPCVIGYTIFNEGWGQFDGERLYRTFKSLDPTRFWDTASGWFVPKETDVDSKHVYFRNKKLKPGKRPMFLSECGGYARKIDGHLWNPANEYGYGKTDTEQQLTDAIGRMYAEMVNPAIPAGLCGVVYTQLSDVEDEINGLYTYDRQVCKVEGARMRAILREAEEILHKATE
ncbi:MAG: glycoside hydrolase family 2 [Clostridiales bacterium]|nr:glycoside hydrolase family 2 [Clostridiales bacterium]